MLILDTHIWHWWFNQIPDKLPASIVDLIETADEVAVSAISCFEMAWLVKHGRIDLGMPFEQWLSLNDTYQSVKVLPINQHIASMAVELPEHHKDPMDRMIIATALQNKARLVSFDTAFTQYEPLNDWLIGKAEKIQ